MKKTIIRLVLASFLATGITTAHAQEPVLNKEAVKVLHAGRITGHITWPKSVGITPNFIDNVKSSVKLYALTIENATIKERKLISITSIKVSNATRTDSPNYSYFFEINAIMPFNKPVDVEIPADWTLPSGKHFFLSKETPAEYAIFSSAKKIYTGFNFKGYGEWHPH